MTRLSAKTFALLLLLLVASISWGRLCAADGNSSAADKLTEQAVLKGSNGGRRFEVRLSKGPFRRDKHRLEQVDENNWKIDGFRESDDQGVRHWHGTDGGLPLEEFYAFEVSVDGRRWNVPPELWKDCYNPSFSLNSDYPTLFAWLSADGERLTVKMLGSDGAGSYRVRWLLRRDGRHSRIFDPSSC